MDESIDSKRNVRVGQLGWCRLDFVCSARRGGEGPRDNSLQRPLVSRPLIDAPK